MKASLAIATTVLVLASCSSNTEEKMSPIKVEIIRTDSGYQLLRGGEPYEIRGAGMGIDDVLCWMLLMSMALRLPSGCR